jgi:hypothetical protein
VAPVPTTVTGTPTVNAQQLGPWAVSADVATLPPVTVSSLPAVTVGALAPAASPDLVRIPFQSRVVLGSDVGDHTIRPPDGYRLVITRVTGSCTSPPTTGPLSISMTVPNLYPGSDPLSTATFRFVATHTHTTTSPTQPEQWWLNEETLVYGLPTSLNNVQPVHIFVSPQAGVCQAAVSGYYLIDS